MTGQHSRQGKRRTAQRGGGPSSPQVKHSQLEVFWGLEVGVFAELNDNVGNLLRELQRLRFAVHHIWPIPPQIPVQYDLVICSQVADLPQRIPWLPGEPESAFVIIDSGTGEVDLKLIQNCGAHGVLQYPVASRSMQMGLAVALDHFHYEKRLRGRISKLDESLRSMRVVERAKAILIRTRNVTEDEAYGYLRHQSMERRVAIGLVAQAIIDMYELIN